MSGTFSVDLLRTPSETHDDASATRGLLVDYIISMGADERTAEDLALSFMTQHGTFKGGQPKKSRIMRRTIRKPPANATSKHKEIQSLQFRVKGPPVSSDLSYAGNEIQDEQSNTGPSPGPLPVGTAVEVQDLENKLSVIYTEPTKVHLKDLLRRRPIKLILFLVLLLIYVTSPKGIPGIKMRTPSMAPSSSPTLIQDDVMLTA